MLKFYRRKICKETDMAPFSIHEDQNIYESTKTLQLVPKDKKKENSRTALATFCNGVIQTAKKIKLENQNIENKEVQKKIDKKLDAKLDEKENYDIILKFKNQTLSRNTNQNLDLTDADYIRRIWRYYKDQESEMYLERSINHRYMEKQRDVTWQMRSIVIDWLVSVAEEYKISNEALYLSINYIDRFLSCISVVRSKIQLVGATALLVASKIEDIYPPELKEMAYLTQDSYTVRQIKKMEQYLLKTLNFKMQPPTVLNFIKHLCTNHNISKETMNLAMYVSELSLMEGKDYIGCIPSKLAAASIAMARYQTSPTIKIEDVTPDLQQVEKRVWPKYLEKATGYSLNQLSPVVQKQHVTFVNSPTKEQKAILTKYQSPKYSKVALLKPRTLKINFDCNEN